jgi:hypothetical protein
MNYPAAGSGVSIGIIKIIPEDEDLLKITGGRIVSVK